jgi:hypothetical protein
MWTDAMLLWEETGQAFNKKGNLGAMQQMSSCAAKNRLFRLLGGINLAWHIYTPQKYINL